MARLYKNLQYSYRKSWNGINCMMLKLIKSPIYIYSTSEFLSAEHTLFPLLFLILNIIIPFSCIYYTKLFASTAEKMLEKRRRKKILRNKETFCRWLFWFIHKIKWKKVEFPRIFIWIWAYRIPYNFGYSYVK